MEEEEEKLQQGAKKAGKFAGKQVGKLIGKVMKKIGTAIVGVIVQFLPYILIAVLITSFVAAIIKFVIVNDGSYVAGSEKNVPNVVNEVLKDIGAGSIGYDIDLDQKVEEIITKLNKDSNQLYAYISEEKQKEYLKTFIKADFITQNFKIGTADPKTSDKLNGSIIVQRSDSDGKVSTLQFIDYETFNKYVTESNSEVFKYFSTNEDGQLVIAQSYRHSKVLDTNVPGETPINEEQYNISEMSLDYKSALSSYAMPFNFLWALLVKSTEEDFVYELAKLAMDTEITITAYDNYMRTEETEESQFTMSGRKELIVRQFIKHSGTLTKITREREFDTSDTTYHRRLTEITETRNVTLNVTYANTWIAKYQNEYTYESIPATVTENNAQSNNSQAIETINRYLTKAEIEQDSFAQEVLNDLEHGKMEGTVYTVESERLISDIKEKSRTGKIVSSGNSYKEGTPQIEEKTDLNSQEPNFCTILKKYPRAESKIMSSVEWLFEMMEQNTENVTNMIDLVKYLLYKATGRDLGVTELSANFFIIKNLSSMYGGSGISVNKTSISREDFIKCVKEYRNDSGYQRRFAAYADKIYDICVKNNINPILCVAQGQESSFGESTPINSPWNYWGLGVNNESSVGTEFATIDEAIECYCKTILGYQKPGSIAYTKAQVYAPHSDKITGNMTSIYDILCAYMYLGDKHSGKVYGNVNVKQYLIQHMNYDCKHELEESTTLEEQAAYVVDYIDNGVISIAKDIFGSKIYSGGSIIEVADMIHKYMEQNNYTYCVLDNSNQYEECGKYNKAHGLNRTFEESKTGYHNTCCATYVSWVLQMVGYIDDSDHSDGAETLAQTILMGKYGWKRVSVAEAQPGDILYYTYGHIEIYAGNNTKYNAGSGDAIRRISPYETTISSDAIVLRAP